MCDTLPENVTLHPGTPNSYHRKVEHLALLLAKVKKRLGLGQNNSTSSILDILIVLSDVMDK